MVFFHVVNVNLLNLPILAAFKIIKAWLPPAAVKKIKFLTKSNMGEYVTEENRLEEWGGSDPWQYQWEHEGVENGSKEFAFEGKFLSEF